MGYECEIWRRSELINFDAHDVSIFELVLFNFHIISSIIGGFYNQWLDGIIYLILYVSCYLGEEMWCFVY